MKILIQKYRFLVLLCFVQWLIHAPFMNKVAMGNHVWRQVNTLAVAKNYHTEDMNILYPRIDKNYATNGITGPQFTSYDYTLALLYRIFGFSETLHRWFSLMLSFFAIAGMVAVMRCYFPMGNTAYWGGLALIGIPEFYYYSIAAVPDLLALAAMLWGWYFFYRFLALKSIYMALVAGSFLTLAGMTKLMFLVPGFVFLGEIIQRKLWHWSYWKGYLIISIMTLGGSGFWYVWAKYLTDMNGINEFVHAIRFKDSLEGVWHVFVKNLLSDTVETWVGYTLLVPFFWGFYVRVKKKFRDLRVQLSLFGAILYYVFMQHQLEHHGYYMILFVPFIVLSVGYALSRLAIQESKLPRWIVLFMFISVGISPVWAVLRMKHNFNVEEPGMSKTFTQQTQLPLIQSYSATANYWIVGPDQSGCVAFYYLGAKGFPWYNLNDSSSEFTRFKAMGAKGIITDNESAARMYCRQENLNLRKVATHENWVWLRFD